MDRHLSRIYSLYFNTSYIWSSCLLQELYDQGTTIMFTEFKYIYQKYSFFTFDMQVID